VRAEPLRSFAAASDALSDEANGWRPAPDLIDPRLQPISGGPVCMAFFCRTPSVGHTPTRSPCWPWPIKPKCGGTLPGGLNGDEWSLCSYVMAPDFALARPPGRRPMKAGRGRVVRDRRLVLLRTACFRLGSHRGRQSYDRMIRLVAGRRSSSSSQAERRICGGRCRRAPRPASGVCFRVAWFLCHRAGRGPEAGTRPLALLDLPAASAPALEAGNDQPLSRWASLRGWPPPTM